jgi:hypothetical protein
MYAIVNPQANPAITNGIVFGPAEDPAAFSMNRVAKYVPTANHPTCNNPINNPGIAYPPRVPNVDDPTTYNENPDFIPIIAGA